MTTHSHGTASPSTRSNTIAVARKEIADLLRPNPVIFWTDFLVSLTVAYSFATVYLGAHMVKPDIWQTHPWLIAASYVISGLALYRVANFMHEVVHFRPGEMKGFRLTWDLLVGIPLLTPSFFYETHLCHHNTHSYGTEEDGEYLPLGNGSLKNFLYFFGQVFVQPLLVCFRFIVLTPISLVKPSWRNAILRRASSFVIDLSYRRPVPEKEPLSWKLIDVACWIRASMIIVTAVSLGSPFRVMQLYSLAVFILSLNYLRTLAAHRYQGEGNSMSHQEQLLDSTNITGSWLTELLCPVGLRFHALHHLFPAIPYHNLGIAHRRLITALPQDSEYHRTVYPSWFAVIRELLVGIKEKKHVAHQNQAA